MPNPQKKYGEWRLDVNIAPSILSTDYKSPPIIVQVMNIVDDSDVGFKNPQRGRVYSVEGIAPAIDCVGGGNREPKIIVDDNLKSKTNMEQTKSSKIELPEELKGKKFRIRKLTPRECFRLMGVNDDDIDKMQAAGISNSGLYKLAGNSIVAGGNHTDSNGNVDGVLFNLFRKMFIETGVDNNGEPQQLTLF